MPTRGHIYIDDLPRAVVLAALYNNAVVKGFGSRLAIDGHMSITQAQDILTDRDRALVIDELNGRFIGLDPSLTDFDPEPYNQANGGATQQLAQIVISHIRSVLTPELFAEATRDFWVPAQAEAASR